MRAKSSKAWWLVGGLTVLWLLRTVGQHVEQSQPTTTARIATPAAPMTAAPAHRSVEDLPPEPTPPPQQFPMASVALFDHGVLDACADYGMLFSDQFLESVRQDMKKRKKPFHDLLEDDFDVFNKDGDSILGDLFEKGSKEAVWLNARCAEQFTGRTTLATCTVNRDQVDASVALRFLGRYYNFASVGRSDAIMQHCLQVAGTWDALPRDSDAFRRARLEYDERRATKAAEEAAARLRKYAP